MPKGMIIQQNKTITLGHKVMFDTAKERLININTIELITIDECQRSHCLRHFP
tara:strand:- start:2267 stop:2425 length:159 start_codon:yes stop_codon:yes gene_type:complete